MGSEMEEADLPEQGESQPEAHIEIRDLLKTFGGGDIVACSDIDLSIGNDEFIVLLGPSGCGKTTTLRCIAGLEIPNDGTIHIASEDVTTKQPKDRDVAFVFQDITLFPHMSVEENIRFGLDLKTDLSADEKEEKVHNVAEMLGISDLLDRKPSALSGGQQQRVSLGRAMIMDPAAFLLDEPFSALDANLRDQMRVEVKKLQRELEKSMVFVTHDQEEAMTLGDRIVIMNEGQIQQIGTPHEIYNEPANQFVAEFIGSPSTNLLPCTLTDDDDGITLSHKTFTVRLTGDEAADLSKFDGQEVTLGIRPEHLRLEGEQLLSATVEVIEPHGDRDAVYLTTGDTELTALTTAGRITEEEASIAVDFDLERLWLFDADGERIY